MSRYEAPDEKYIYKQLNPHQIVAIAPEAGLVFRFNNWEWQDAGWTGGIFGNMTDEEYDACYLDVDAGGVFDGSGKMIISLEEDFSEAIFNDEIGDSDDWELGNLESIEEEIKKGGYRGWTKNPPIENLKYQKGGNTSMLTVAGTLIGFGAFGYSVVKLTQKDWRNAAMAGVGGIAVLSLVGWNLRKMTGFNAPTRNFMKRSEVEKVLDASQGKIVGVTFVKKDGSERTLVGRIQKRYSPTGTDPLGGKAARRARGLFTIYDMQKGAFRMVNMDTVLGIRAGGKTYSA